MIERRDFQRDDFVGIEHGDQMGYTVNSAFSISSSTRLSHTSPMTIRFPMLLRARGKILSYVKHRNDRCLGRGRKVHSR
jgi:hypothetical protein